MRVRITQALSGSIDGIQLSRFTVGLTYDVGTSLGSYLLAQRFAIPVEDVTPALVLPMDDVIDTAVPSLPRTEAADRAQRQRDNDRKTSKG
jgi:hypothetical protein